MFHFYNYAQSIVEIFLKNYKDVFFISVCAPGCRSVIVSFAYVGVFGRMGWGVELSDFTDLILVLGCQLQYTIPTTVYDIYCGAIKPLCAHAWEFMVQS